jgi:hypothetical protein
LTAPLCGTCPLISSNSTSYRLSPLRGLSPLWGRFSQRYCCAKREDVCNWNWQVKLPAENVEARFMKDQHVCKKVKQSLNTLMAAQRERSYRSYSFTTSTLYGVSGQCHAPAALYSRRKDPRHPLYRRLGGPQSRSGNRS